MAWPFGHDNESVGQFDPPSPGQKGLSVHNCCKKFTFLSGNVCFAGEDYQQWYWSGDQLVNHGTGYNLTVGGCDSWVYQMWTESGGPVFSLPMEDRMVLAPRGRSLELVHEDSQLDEFWILYN